MTPLRAEVVAVEGAEARPQPNQTGYKETFAGHPAWSKEITRRLVRHHLRTDTPPADAR